MNIDIASVITAIGTIVLGYFTYNQYTKNKLTDLKLKQLEEEDKRQNRARADNAALVYGELWNVLHLTGADRAYIIQPHPLGNEEMITIYFEVKRKEAASMKPHIQRTRMCDVAKFASDLAKNMYLCYTNIDEQVTDSYSRAIIKFCGCVNCAVKRLSDNKHDWVGSLLVEFSKPMEIDEGEVKGILENAAINIQYILPDIKD